MGRGFVLLFIFISSAIFSQTSVLVAFSPDYKFREGVFITFEQFLKNRPVPKSAIVSEADKTAINFLTQVIEQKIITYVDTANIEHKISTDSAWGYSQNNIIYINYNKEFNRMHLIGTLSFFSALVVQTARISPNIGGIYSIEPSYQELQKFILETKTQKVYEYNADNMELLLKSDNELYSEFMKLKRREKTNALHIYLRKYNEKYPLYLPSE